MPNTFDRALRALAYHSLPAASNATGGLTLDTLLSSAQRWVSGQGLQGLLLNALLVVATVAFLWVYLRLLTRFAPDFVRVLRSFLNGPRSYERYQSIGSMDIDKMREDNEKRTNKLRAAIMNGVKNGALQNLSDVCSLFDGLPGPRSADAPVKRARARRVLQAMILDALAGEQPELQPDDALVIPKLQAFVAEKDHGDPYADLPDRERSVFQDLAAFVSASDADNSVRKLGELASIFMTRDDDIARLQSANRTTLWLTVFGFMSSVVFGLIAILK